MKSEVYTSVFMWWDGGQLSHIWFWRCIWCFIAEIAFHLQSSRCLILKCLTQAYSRRSQLFHMRLCPFLPVRIWYTGGSAGFNHIWHDHLVFESLLPAHLARYADIWATDGYEIYEEIQLTLQGKFESLIKLSVWHSCIGWRERIVF